MRSEAILEVEGSTGEIHTVRVRPGDPATITCTCTAAKNGSHCRHRLSILTDDFSSCIEVTSEICDWVSRTLRGSPAKTLAAELRDAEAALRDARLARDAISRRLSNAMLGRRV